MSDNEDANLWAECARCKGPRRCKVQARFKEKGNDGEHYNWQEEWRVLQCCGCDYTFVQKVSTNSEDYVQVEEEEWESIEKKTYWPALAKRKMPEWMSEYGIDVHGFERLDEVLIELYKALENDLVVLSAIGIRTSFDVASELLSIDPNLSFAAKLDALVDQAQIGKPDRSRLETIVQAGNASAHQGWKPNPHELNVMAEILEHFVYDAFVAPSRKAKLDAKATKMKEGVPLRTPRVKKPKSGGNG